MVAVNCHAWSMTIKEQYSSHLSRIVTMDSIRNELSQGINICCKNFFHDRPYMNQNKSLIIYLKETKSI